MVDLIPRGVAYSTDQLLKQMIAAGRKVARFPVSDHWLDIGQMADLEKADDFVSTELALNLGRRAREGGREGVPGPCRAAS